ncbi:hypothetical protein JCM10450v2_004151 [Rhodotorula kratochvilovae]
MLDDPFLAARQNAAAPCFDLPFRLPASTGGPAAAAKVGTFALLGASAGTGKENAPQRQGQGQGVGLAPSPRLVLSSSSSASSGGRAGARPRPERRVTFSPTPLPSLQASPRHKRVWVALGGHCDERDTKRARWSGEGARGVYSNNPLLLSAREASSSSSPAGATDSPLFSAADAATATPPTSSPARAPPRASALRVCSAAPPRSPPRPLSFRPFTLPPSSVSSSVAAAQAEDDPTDSESESSAVQSLLLPRSLALPTAATAGAAASSSSPLPSPSHAPRPLSSALKGILKPRPARAAASVLGSEKEAWRRNARGRRHAVGWDAERKAAVLASRATRAAGREGEGGAEGGKGAKGKGKARARDGGNGGGSVGGRAVRAGGSRAGGGGAGRDEDDEDQQRRRRLNAGSSSAPPPASSSSSSAASLGGAGGGGDDTRRIVHDLDADDPAHFRSPLLVLRASLRPSPGGAFPPLSTAAYDGAAPSLPPRAYAGAPLPPLEDGPVPPRRRFAAPTLLADVEEAYVLLTHAAFRLPAGALPDAERTLAPLRELGAVLVAALTRDVGNVGTFNAWVEAQPAPPAPAPAASLELGLGGELGSTPPQSGQAQGKRSLTEEQMRRLRDEMGAAQAALKCAAALFRDERIVALFDGAEILTPAPLPADDTLASLVRLIALVPLSPALPILVQQHLLPFVPFFLSAQRLPPALLAPLVPEALLPSLSATLTLPPRIDRHRSAAAESLSALAALLPHAGLARAMLDCSDGAWREWLLPAFRGLWDGPKKAASVRDRTVRLLGRVVRALTMPLEGEGEDVREWAGRREQVAEEIGKELQEFLNSELPGVAPDAKERTWLDLLSKQLDAAQAPGPDGEEPTVAARLGVISLLAVLPPLMRSSFRRLETKTVVNVKGEATPQSGITPWLRPMNAMHTQTAHSALVLSALAWSHLSYAFCGTVSGRGGKSWILRLPDQRPFLVIRSILDSRQHEWEKPADDEADPVGRDERRQHARALTLALVGVAYGVAVHIQHGTSAVRDPAAPIDPPTSTRRLEQLDHVHENLLMRYLPAATSSPPVSAQVAALGWELLASIVRPRTALCNTATLDALVNTAFLDGSLATLAQEKQALFVAGALDRAVQPAQVPGWGRTWVTTRTEKVLELFEACLPRASEPELLVEATIADTWIALLASLAGTLASLRAALRWLAKLSAAGSPHAGIAAKLWTVTFASGEDALLREVGAVVEGDKEAVAAATKAWLAATPQKLPSFAEVFVAAWTKILAKAKPSEVTAEELHTVVHLLRTHVGAPTGSELATGEGWSELAHAVNSLVWQDDPAANDLSSHLVLLVSTPTDVTSDLLLITLLVSASHDFDADAQTNILTLSEHAVKQVLLNEYPSNENIALIARLLEVASDEAFPSLYDRVLQQLATVVRPTSDPLQRFSSLLAPSLNRAYELSLAVDEPDSQAFLGASLAQHSFLHATHRPILAFDTFWKATFGRATTDLAIPEEMVELLQVMKGISADFVVRGLADTQETASQLSASAPPARATATTAAADLSGRAYDADQSRLPADASSFTSGSAGADSSFTPAAPLRGGGRAASPSLHAPGVAEETQVVDETPKEVEVQRARESFAALTSEATELELESASASGGEDGGKGKRRRDSYTDDDDEVIAATDEEDTAQTRPKKSSPPPLKKVRSSKRTRASEPTFEVVVPESTRPASKKRPAPSTSSTELQDASGAAKKKRKGATTRSRSRGKADSVSPAPPTSADEPLVIENSQPAPQPAAPVVTDSQEETLRRFFALPLDTVIEAGKRLGGSPSLKRLMDLGERAREYFERVSQSSSQ